MRRVTYVASPFRGLLGLLAPVLVLAVCGCGARTEPGPASVAEEGIGDAVQHSEEPSSVPEVSAMAAAESSSPAPVPPVPPRTEPPRGEPAPTDSAEVPGPTVPAAQVSDPVPVSETRSTDAAAAASLEEQLAGAQVPPSWLEAVATAYDTSLPWKDARLEVRRLLSLNTAAARREAIKVTWIYLQKGDIGDGHEYPMYLFLGGEPLWAILAHEEFLAKPHPETPIHAHLTLASLYARFGAMEKAEATLVEAMANLPGPPWRIAREADLHNALGDLYAAWGKIDLARHHYTEAVRLYPTSNQPYGQHLLKRQAGRVQTKLDLLSARSLTGAALRDGQYTATALGYAGDLNVTLTVRGGKIADLRVKHEEKIDQGACAIIPQRIIESQSLLVDGISGATVTKDAIVDGALQCLRKAGLP